MSIETQSRTALAELIALLQEIDARWSGPEWNLHSAEDIVASHRSLMHTLETALVGYFEQDASQPDFRRIVTPSRKLTGDNSDAIYFDAPVSGDHAYVIHGSMHGAAYFSLTIEEGAEDGKMATNTYCIQCTECLQACPNDNLAVNLRPWAPIWLPRASRAATRHTWRCSCWRSAASTD